MGDLVTMANEGHVPAMGSLTPALRKSLDGGNEADLSPEQFALVVQFANAPCPTPERGTADQINRIITALASVLKSPNVSSDHGKLKLAVYRKALERVPLVALEGAANHAIQTLEWMPTPAEIIKLAEGRHSEAQHLHAKACAFRRNRAQRLHEETLRTIRNRELSHDDLQRVDEFTARVADTQGLIVTMMDGTRHYRTRETIHAQMEERERANEAAKMSGARAREGAETEENVDG